jgi:PAS domain S-box-containing protein
VWAKEVEVSANRPATSLPDDLFDFIPDPVFILDRRGVFLAANRSTSRYLCHDPGDLTGRSLAEIFPAEQVQAQLGVLERIIRTGEDFVEQRVTPIGEETYVFEYRMRLLPSGGGEPPRVLGMVRDVTGLVALERRYAELYEKATDALFAIDTEGKIRALNRRAELMSGYSRDALESLHFSEVVAPDEVERLRRYFADRVAGRDAPTEYEVRFLNAKGEERWAEVHISRETSSLGAFQASLRDVTERKRLEVMRRDFLHMISHDVKNPLAVIQGFASAMDTDLYGPMSGAQHDCLQRILGASQRVRCLMEQFLLAEQIENSAQWQPQPGPAARALWAAHTAVEADAKAKGVVLESEAGDLGDVRVGDLEGLRHILENLTSNALKFTDPGGRIRVRARRDGDLLRFEVEDTGIGIPELELSRIFDRFFRGAGAAGTEGSGLGLHIVRRLTEQAGGRVCVTSRPGKGTVFVVELPAHPQRPGQN